MESPPVLIGSIYTSQLGDVWVALSENGLEVVEFGVSRTTFETTVRKHTRRLLVYEPDAVADVAQQLKEYLEGKRRSFSMTINWSALTSDFQRAALRIVYSIPYGQTRTYAEVASQMYRPKAQRAVGRANATNPMPLVIPCHRVIGTDGKLHGYGGKGGVKTKEWLLKMEKDN